MRGHQNARSVVATTVRWVAVSGTATRCFVGFRGCRPVVVNQITVSFFEHGLAPAILVFTPLELEHIALCHAETSSRLLVANTGDIVGNPKRFGLLRMSLIDNTSTAR